MQKLYCYVDETGQDTKGQLFIVALIITGPEREQIRSALERIEASSGKREKKWKKTIPQKKQTYIERVFALPDLKGKCFYAEHRPSGHYLTHILDALMKGIQALAKGAYKATIFIDALRRDERKIVGAQLRRRQIHVEKVRGLRDESDAFIRCADAIAGFVRDATEGQAYAKNLYARVIKQGVLRKL